MKVGIVNYGMGNLGSVRRALEDLNADVFIAENPETLFQADRIVLPGVGSFSEGMTRLESGGWVESIGKLVHRDRKPMLGICLGMQMLATTGSEGGSNAGLGLIDGKVRHLGDLGCELRIPHVGWNDVTFSDSEPLFGHIPQHSDFYFVHSYAFEAARPQEVSAWADYGIPIAATVRRQNVFGTQFHPEKSSKAGRQVLQNFLDFQPC